MKPAEKQLKEKKAEVRRLRRAMREIWFMLDQELSPSYPDVPEIDRLTEPRGNLERAYSVAVKAHMGPEKFKKWVARRRREIAEAV